MLKKILVLIIALELVLIIPLYFVRAGYVPLPGIEIQSRLEVSSDNTNWVNYVAEDNSGNQTLTVTPGSTIYFRIKAWNTGDANAGMVNMSSTFTNPSYLTNSSFLSTSEEQDLDGDSTPYLPSPFGYVAETGTADFTLLFAQANSTVDSNFQSSTMAFQTSASTPEQTVILATIQVTSAGPWLVWLDKLVNRAHADANGTSQARILVANPAATPTSTPTPTSSAAAVVSTLPATGPDGLK